MHIPTELTTAIITSVVPLAGIILSHILQHGKLSKIYLSTNGTVSKLIQDVEDGIRQIEQLKQQLKQAEQPEPKG